MKLACILLTAAACGAGAGASAQTVYRCGNEYTRVPCAEGKVIDTENRATPAQRTEGREVAVREKRLAETMARDRRQQEAALKPAKPANVGPGQPAAAASAPARKGTKKKRAEARSAEERDFVAAIPKSKRAPN